MYQPLYSGFDTLDVAFQGALPHDALKLLAEAKEQAAKDQEPILIHLGPGQVPILVQPSGIRGGYAFRAHTGPVGEIWAFKDNSDLREWNIFVSVRAAALACRGYHATRDRLLEQLEAMGARILSHSVNRIDYAMDFLTDRFELRLDSFVAHRRTRIRPHWEELTHWMDRLQPSAIFRGRRIEAATIGKMPGRQIIVYDKRRAAIDLQTYFWFEIWGIDRKDRTREICRVEPRAGKKELTRWRLRTFSDIEAGIGDVFRQALEDIRYLSHTQTDTNVTRQRLDPLWNAAKERLDGSLIDFRSGVLPSQIIAIERETAIQRYASLFLSKSYPRKLVTA